SLRAIELVAPLEDAGLDPRPVPLDADRRSQALARRDGLAPRRDALTVENQLACRLLLAVEKHVGARRRAREHARGGQGVRFEASVSPPLGSDGQHEGTGTAAGLDLEVRGHASAHEESERRRRLRRGEERARVAPYASVEERQ